MSGTYASISVPFCVSITSNTSYSFRLQAEAKTLLYRADTSLRVQDEVFYGWFQASNEIIRGIR